MLQSLGCINGQKNTKQNRPPSLPPAAPQAEIFYTFKTRKPEKSTKKFFDGKRQQHSREQVFLLASERRSSVVNA